MTQTHWKFLKPLESGVPENSPIEAGDTLLESLYKLQGQTDSLVDKSDLSFLVSFATVAQLTATYNNGTDGVGATLTNNSTQIPLVIDNNIVTLNDRILVKNQGDERQNGVYYVSVVGDYSTNWVLTRTSDYDNHEPGLLRADNFIVVHSGLWNKQTIWIQTSKGTGAYRSIIIGSENITYLQIANSFEVGDQSLVRIPGTFATANGRFSNTGDAQEGKYILRNRTTNEVTKELFLDGEDQTLRLTIPDYSTWLFEAKISAKQTNGEGHGTFIVKGCVNRENGASTTRILGHISKEIITRSNTNWNVNILEDVTNGSLKLEVTGEFGKIIRWLAVVTTTEITN